MAVDNRPQTVSLEPLETRRLLAAQILGGELQVVGTHKNDDIRVYVDPRVPDQLSVIVNRTVERFPVVAIDRINILAGQGHDRVQVEGSSPRYNVPTRLYGSGGNDTIFGGQGLDRIYGGDGDDSISGGRAKDIIYGEAGNDNLSGDAGHDYIVGGIDDDTLTGWEGIDYLLGESGNDFIDSLDEQTDRVDGGIGSDRARADTILDQTFISIETFVIEASIA